MCETCDDGCNCRGGRFARTLLLVAVAFMGGILFDVFCIGVKERCEAQRREAERLEARDAGFIPAPEEWCEDGMEHNVMTNFWTAIWVERSPRESERKGFVRRYYIRKGQPRSQIRVLETDDAQTW